MTKLEAENQIRRIANDARLQITGTRGDWYIDNTESTVLDRRSSGHRTLAAVVTHVRDCIGIGHPIIHLA